MLRSEPKWVIVAEKKNRRFGRRWGVIGLLGASAVGYALIERPWQEKPRDVPVEIVSAGPVSQVLAVNGRVAARTSVSVRAAVSAQVLKVEVSEGQKVETGDVLLVLDTAIIDAQVEQASAALEAQIAQQSQAQATVDRSRALGSSSPRATLEDAEFKLATAKQETARLEAALRQVQRQLAEYTIRAPMSGVVLSRDVDIGQLVDLQNELFVIADISDVIVETDIDELYSSHVKEGLKALLKPVGASVAQPGSVVFAAPRVDSVTGGRRIKIGFDEPASLPVGLTVNANVIVNEVASALSLPRRAIIANGAQSHVLVLEDGVAMERQIRFGDWPSERVIINDGVREGEIVILDPATVKAGDKAVAASE